MNEDKVRDWLKVQPLGYLLETLDTVSNDISDWESVILAEKVADILLELDSEKCYEDFAEGERVRKEFNYLHSAYYESGRWTF